MEKLTLQIPPLSPKTELYFSLAPLASVCHAISNRGAILIDAAIAKSHGPAIQKALAYELIPVPSGEKHKTRETKAALEDALFKHKLGRDTLLVAVGGGMVTDLVGFVAATYMRGVPLVLIPTTLLGMVDAAIGGKTGVDTPFGKNTIGSLYLPHAVFIDADLLKTLPEKEMKNGLSEVLKYGLISDEVIWAKGENWKNELPFLLRASIACKIKIIEQDFAETGLRRTLNFGHTVGHALELLSGFQMPHGEAVALGCMAESYLSHLLGYLPKGSLDSILSLYRKLGYVFPSFSSKALLDAMTLDKKAKNGEPRFVLIDRIGHCLPFEGNYCRTVGRKELEKMMSWMA